MILKSEAIVLKSFDYRETSKIVTFLTKDYGKISGLLKGIRKDHKKFGSQVDKFSVNHIVFYWHRDSELHLVGQCDLTHFFFPVRKEIPMTMAANYAVELVNKLIPPEEKNQEVYELLFNFLASLQMVKDINALIHIFQVKILYLSGFRPHLDSCLACKKVVHGEAWFSPQQGGLLCLNCQSKDASAVPMSKGAIASILHIEKSNWERSLRLAMVDSVKKELKYLLNNFLVFHLERPIKSAKYLPD